MRTLIEVTMRDIYEGREALKELSLIPLKARVAYKVARLMREIDKENTLFEQRRNEMIHKYCAKNENGEDNTDENGQIKVAQENLAVFMTEINELLDEKIELVADKIKLDELDCELTSNQLERLFVFIDE